MQAIPVCETISRDRTIPITPIAIPLATVRLHHGNDLPGGPDNITQFCLVLLELRED
jgi:hypothetical protein